MKVILWVAAAWLAGMVAGMNLAYLVPNPVYEFGWWKVVIALGGLAVFAANAVLAAKESAQ